jgi:hypothetical protein
MGFFGFLGAPGRFIERVTGARASRQKGTAAREQFDQQKRNLDQANAQSLAHQKRLQQMLDEISGLDRQQKTVQKEYKGKLKTLEYEEQHLKGLGQQYTATIEKVEAKGSELLKRKSQLEERSAQLNERVVPLEQKLKEISEKTKKVDGQEIKTLVDDFQAKFKAVEANKEKLKGISRETSPELFLRHERMVKALEPLRKKTEGAIHSKHGELSKTHQKIALELSHLQKDYQNIESEGQHIRRGQEKLERKKRYIDTYQGMLEPELKKFSEGQEAFKAQAEGLKVFQEKLTDLEKNYTQKKTEAQTLQEQLQGTNAYQDTLVNRLKGLQKDIEFHAQRYQERSSNASLIKAGVAGLATMGAGAALGVGGGLANLATGLSVLGTMNSAKNDVQKNLQKFAAYSDFVVEDFKVGGIPDWNKRPLNRIDFKSRVFDTKIKMPEFGGLAQSIKHFDMPTLPTLAELPHLSEVLGNVRSSEDIANLGVLPGNTARSPNRSLLNPELIKTFETLMKKRTLLANGNKKKTGGLGTLSLPRRGLAYGR